MKPYKTRITNPWGEAVGGQVLVSTIYQRSATTTITLRDHTFATEQPLNLAQMRTLKASLEQGQPAQLGDLSLAWDEDRATLILGQMRLVLDKEKVRQLITLLGASIPAEVEPAETLLPWYR